MTNPNALYIIGRDKRVTKLDSFNSGLNTRYIAETVRLSSIMDRRFNTGLTTTRTVSREIVTNSRK